MVSNFENVKYFNKAKMRLDKNAILTYKKEQLENFLCLTKDVKKIFTLGNNHLHDLGEEGIRETLDDLKKNDIEYTGISSGTNDINVFIIEHASYKIGILALSTDNYQVMSILATEDKIGVIDLNHRELADLIKETKKKVDYLIINPHWGKEFMYYPSIENRKLAYLWIDNGADLVVGHHPHVIQGKEEYKGKRIYYSLGNFIFPNFYTKNNALHKWSKENNYSISISLSFEDCSKKPIISELGSYFDINKNELVEAKDSIRMLVERSKYLDVKSYEYKRYYNLWEDDYYRVLKKTRKKINKYINMLLLEHKEYGKVEYIIKRLKKRWKKWMKS